MTAPRHPAPQLAPMVAIAFLGFLAIGLPLATLPLFIHDTLKQDPSAVGWIIGTQPLFTVLTRGMAGRLVDRFGARKTALIGLPVACLSGCFTLLALLPDQPEFAIVLLLIGRMTMGPAESMFLTGALSWAIGRVGPSLTGLVMSWQGVAIFGALGIGAPLGLWIMGSYGFVGVVLLAIACPLVGIVIAATQKGVPLIKHATPSMSFFEVLGRIWRPGLALLMAAAPFMILTSFVALYYQDRGWQGAGFSVLAFVAGHVGVRIFMGGFPDKFGGLRVGAYSVLVEIVGLAILVFAPSAPIALVGALVLGMGNSLVFPAMGVESMRMVPAHSRGMAIGGFVAFVDLAGGIVPPAAGKLIEWTGYRTTFLLGGICCVLALLFIWLAKREADKTKAAHAKTPATIS